MTDKCVLLSRLLFIITVISQQPIILLLLLPLLLSARVVANLSQSQQDLFHSVPHVIVLDLNRHDDVIRRSSPHQSTLKELLAEKGVASPDQVSVITAVRDLAVKSFVHKDGSWWFRVLEAESNTETDDHAYMVSWGTTEGKEPGLEDRTRITHVLAHLCAARLAWLLDIDYVVVIEAGVDIWGALLRCGGHSIHDMVQALPQESWTVLQLGYAFEGVTNALDMYDRFARGELISPYDLCVATSAVAPATHAYVLHRRGMQQMLSSYWPNYPHGLVNNEAGRWW